MKSENIGAPTSAVELLNVSPHGFWLLVNGTEYFLGADEFPLVSRGDLETIV
jgi:hypothetical protein